MMSNDILKLCPPHWIEMDIVTPFEIFELHPESHEYKDIQELLLGDYYASVKSLYKIQNPMEYAKFKLKKDEYAKRGNYQIQKLFHDTVQDNINSIANHNFQTVCAERCKQGWGIYFCSDPDAANRRSNKENGEFRAMFVVDVLIQNTQVLTDDECCFLPESGFDTVVDDSYSPTYVKYFESEFYPSYFMTYVNNVSEE